jgi:hypothetical protein
MRRPEEQRTVLSGTQDFSGQSAAAREVLRKVKKTWIGF